MLTTRDEAITVSETFADKVLSIEYGTLPADVVETAKRILVDALACTMGGYDSPTGYTVRDYVRRFGGDGAATIIGTDLRVTTNAAIIANEAMLRYLDYNDDFDIFLGPSMVAGCHPSGSLPVAFAIGETERVSGRRFIEAIVAGYEIIAETITRFKDTTLQKNGFHHGTVHAFGGATMAACLYGLNRDQLVNAYGLTGSLNAGLDILDADNEAYHMTKNFADGLIANGGVIAAQLAACGGTGSERIFEGDRGWAHSLLGGRENFDFDREWSDRFHILDTEFKSACAELTTRGHLHATCTLVEEHDIRPEQIEKITVRSNKRSVTHTASPRKRYPDNKETADHSSPYLQAIAVLEGPITPRSYREENYQRKDVRELIGRVDVVHGPEFDGEHTSAHVTIDLKDGRTFQRQATREEVLEMHEATQSDEGLRDKFVECAGNLLSGDQIDDVIETCLSIDSAADVSSLFPKLKTISESAF